MREQIERARANAVFFAPVEQSAEHNRDEGLTLLRAEALQWVIINGELPEAFDSIRSLITRNCLEQRFCAKRTWLSK